MMKTLQPITIIGKDSPGGFYLLRIQASKDALVRFGQYRQGALVEISSGEYVYIGSAQGLRGSTTLASRLLRHASRSGGKHPHLIRGPLAEQLQSVGLGGVLPEKKTLHWHVDYLLDLAAVEISHVMAFRCGDKIESRLAKMIEDQPETVTFAPRLGASDRAGGTHLLYVNAGEDWWFKMIGLLRKEVV
jgi:Uri superfamily endonuclease